MRSRSTVMLTTKTGNILDIFDNITSIYSKKMWEGVAINPGPNTFISLAYFL